jgi:hypothetical protein
LIALLGPASAAQAMPASPFPVDLKQPDGTRIVLHVRGNAHFNWLEDIQGYTVVVV